MYFFDIKLENKIVSNECESERLNPRLEYRPRLDPSRTQLFRPALRQLL